MSDIESEILTLQDVAAYPKAGKQTVYRLAQKGEIPAFKLGGPWRFRRQEPDRRTESNNKKKPEAKQVHHIGNRVTFGKKPRGFLACQFP